MFIPPGKPSEILGYVGEKFPQNVKFLPPQILEAALSHRSTQDRAIAQVAPFLSYPALTIVVDNQKRMLRSPDILKALLANPNLSLVDSERLKEWGIREGLLEAPAVEVPPEPILDVPAEPIEEPAKMSYAQFVDKLARVDVRKLPRMLKEEKDMSRRAMLLRKINGRS